MASSTSPASTPPRPAAIEGRVSPHIHEPLAHHWRMHLPRYAGELVGTFILVFVATGAVVANAAAGGVITHVGVAIATGLVVTAMVYSLGHLTGAHFNPAVSLAFAAGRHFPIRDLLPYWLAQLGRAPPANLPGGGPRGEQGHRAADLPALAGGRAALPR